VLILTRKASEAIAIGDQITVRILGIQGKQVRLGVTAPTQIPVHREEVYKRILEEAKTAASSHKSDILGARRPLTESQKRGFAK